MTKLNKKIIFLAIFMILTTTTVILVLNIYSSEIKLDAKNGLENPVLRAHYKDFLNRIPEERITMYYFEYDLNSDGLMDKIVFILSPEHLGTGGHGFYILLNNGDGSFEEVTGMIIHFIKAYERGDAELYISRKKTNGLHDIIIKDRVTIFYEDGRMRPKMD